MTENGPPPAAKSFGARFDGQLPTVAASPQTVASEPSFTSAARSDSAQPGADPWVAAVNPAVAPVARPSTFTLPTIATPALAHPAPAPPPPANPTPAVIAPPAASAAPSAQPVAVRTVKTVTIEREKAEPVEQAKPVRPLGSEEIETLLKQGDDFVMVGDFVSARLVYRRIAEADDARGALAFAATYDPIVLTKISRQGRDP